MKSIVTRERVLRWLILWPLWVLAIVVRDLLWRQSGDSWGFSRVASVICTTAVGAAAAILLGERIYSKLQQGADQTDEQEQEQRGPQRR